MTRLIFGLMGIHFILIGCTARYSDDVFRHDDLDPQDQAVIDQDRANLATGGSIRMVSQPEFVYINGALVDTNRARWEWIANGKPPLASRQASDRSMDVQASAIQTNPAAAPASPTIPWAKPNLSASSSTDQTRAPQEAAPQESQAPNQQPSPP